METFRVLVFVRNRRVIVMINKSPSSVEVTSGIAAKETQKKLVDQSVRDKEVVTPIEEAATVDNKVAKTASVELKKEEEELQKAIKESVAEVIPKVREMMQKNQRSLDFKVAEQENRVIITVIDKETDEIIRQIPPEDVVKIAKEMGQGIDDALLGILVDSYA